MKKRNAICSLILAGVSLSTLLLQGCGSSKTSDGKIEVELLQYKPEAVAAFEYLARTEGIICAIESAHAVAEVIKLAPTMNKDEIIIICLSGRGDKDVAAIARYRGVDLHE